MSKVSVVLCSYNGEKYIQAQLESILRQSYPPFEIIVQDDDSTDATVRMARDWHQKDVRIKLWQNKVNLGFNQNFESAIAKAEGLWIALSDQDDLWHPDKIKTMLTLHDKKSLLIHCSSVLFREEPDFSARHLASHRRFSGSDARQLFIRNTVEGHNILFHRDLLPNALPFPDGVYFDWWLGYCAAISGGVQWMNQTLVWRRIHDNNQSSGQETRAVDLIRTYQAFLNHPLTSEIVKNFGETLIQLLKDKDVEKLEAFLWENRKIAFFFKQKPFLQRLSDKKRMRQFVESLHY